VPLAGLILTENDAAVPLGQCQALFPIVGQTLVEYQVRSMRACGVGHIVVLVDEVPAALVAAFDRLRVEGIDIDIARSAAEAADRIHPDEHLLVAASGVVVARSLIADMAARTKPVLLTLVDSPQTFHFERIDGVERWAGLALLNGDLLRQTASLLGDWTLGPTLLRTALQSGAERMRHTGSAVLSLVQNEAVARETSDALAVYANVPDQGLWAQHVTSPIVRRLAPQLLARAVPLDLITILPIIFVGMGLLFAPLGWLASAWLTFLFAGLSAGVASAMVTAAARAAPALSWFERLNILSFCILTAMTGWSLYGGGLDYAALVLALWACSTLAFLPRAPAAPVWRAETDILAVEMMIACAVGKPIVGLIVIVAHLIATQFAFRRSEGQI
jgi:hypothetical protein